MRGIGRVLAHRVASASPGGSIEGLVLASAAAHIHPCYTTACPGLVRQTDILPLTEPLPLLHLDALEVRCVPRPVRTTARRNALRMAVLSMLASRYRDVKGLRVGGSCSVRHTQCVYTTMASAIIWGESRACRGTSLQRTIPSPPSTPAADIPHSTISKMNITRRINGAISSSLLLRPFVATRCAHHAKAQLPQGRPLTVSAVRQQHISRIPVTKKRGQSKIFDSVDEAVADVRSGAVILSSGFGVCSTAETIIDALARGGLADLRSLTTVSNNAGTAIGGGLTPLFKAGQVSRAVCSYLGSDKALEKKYLTGGIAIERVPQGTIAEKLRCGGAGIPAFFTPTGVNTFVQS